MKQIANSLSDLKHLKATLDQQRAEAAARLRAEQEERQRLQAEQRLFVHAVGKVQPLSGNHHGRVALRGEPVAPRPVQRAGIPASGV